MSTSYIDIHIDSVGGLRTTHYDERDFNFPMNLKFICSNIPAAPTSLSTYAIFQRLWFLS